MTPVTMRQSLRLLVAAVLVSGATTTRAQSQIRDTSKVRQTTDGWVLDFQQQPLRVVINALAEAGGLNVTTANIPARNVDLRLGQGLDRAGIIEVLKGVAASNNLQVYETASLIRIEGQPALPQLSPAQRLAQQQAENAPQLFTYRLKHASAVQLAPVLTALFQGITRQTVTSNSFQISIPGITLPGRGGGPGQSVSVQDIVGSLRDQTQTVRQAEQQTRQTDRTQQQAGRGGNPAAGLPGGSQPGRGNQQQQRGNTALSPTAGDVRIVPEESTNSLLIRASEQDFALIQQILQTVDLRPLQVLIEVTIAEVTRSDDLNVGVASDVTRTPAGKTEADASTSFPSMSSARDFVMTLTGGKGTIDFAVALNALATRGDLRVLSMPVVIAQNNREATLNVGSSRPFVQVTQAGGIDPNARVQTIQYIDVGTVLTITPTINPDGYVNLQVTQTANSATNEVQFDAPIISKREATTQVFVRDGQTTVVGGLADNSNSTTRSGIPLLRDIPLLGWLFRGTQKQKSTSELYLFLTPHVVTSDEDLERLRDAIRNNSQLLKDVPIGGRIPPKTDTLSVPPVVRPPTTRPPGGNEQDREIDRSSMPLLRPE